MGDFIARNLANTAWAFATLGQLGEKMCAALAMAPWIANKAWAFATLGQRDALAICYTVCTHFKNAPRRPLGGGVGQSYEIVCPPLSEMAPFTNMLRYGANGSSKIF